MKLSFGGTLDTRTACEALKKIKEFYMKRTKTFEYKTNKYQYQGCAENWAPIVDIPNFGSFLPKNWVGVGLWVSIYENWG